jgi:hypothetical protein
VNDELERMWKEAVVFKFKVLSWYLSRTEENHKTSQDSRPPGRDLNPVSPDYEVGVLTTAARHYVIRIVWIRCINSRGDKVTENVLILLRITLIKGINIYTQIKYIGQNFLVRYVCE